MNYYNEHDPKAAAWLRELIAMRLIPAGEVDERSIVDVRAAELHGFTQCHFFAGIGGWSHALRLADWPDDREVWTGSCPCQCYSHAGQGKGVSDHRDLWPVFAALIRECRPSVVFGEQVEAAIGYGWLDRLRTDLEAEGYAVGGAVLGAHSVGAPHRRQRLYWVAKSKDANGRGELEAGVARVGRGGFAGGGDVGPVEVSCGIGRAAGGASEPGQDVGESQSEQRGCIDGLGDPIIGGVLRGDKRGLGEGGQQVAQSENGAGSADEPCDGCEDAGALANAECDGRNERRSEQPGQFRSPALGGAGATVHFWSEYAIIPCRDGKARIVEPGVAPLVNGIPRGVVPGCDPSEPGYANATAEARVMRLKGYGNAINPYCAAVFIYASDTKPKGAK